jgi:cell division protein FtsB
MANTAFEDRCQGDPQGVIADLVKQTTKQAKAIHELNKENEALKKELEKLKKPSS